MRYFIGCLVRGKAETYQQDLIENICRRFDVRNLNNHVPAHFTLKSPFQTENISVIEGLLCEFCAQQKAAKIVIDGIGSFGEHIIFLDGTSKDGEQVFRRLIKELQKIEWMQFREYELTDVNFHSTLARSRDKKQFEKIMQFLESEKPIFDVQFDNITIFANIEGKWSVYREFRLAGS